MGWSGDGRGDSVGGGGGVCRVERLREYRGALNGGIGMQESPSYGNSMIDDWLQLDEILVFYPCNHFEQPVIDEVSFLGAFTWRYTVQGHPV